MFASLIALFREMVLTFFFSFPNFKKKDNETDFSCFVLKTFASHIKRIECFVEKKISFFLKILESLPKNFKNIH